MFPELFTIGFVRIHTYGLMVALGILAGVTLAEHLPELVNIAGRGATGAPLDDHLG